MPYDLKSYENGSLITTTGTPPQATGAFETFAQAGWIPGAQASVVNGTTYRLDSPDGTKRKVKVIAVGAGLNSITYEWQGLA